MLDEAKTLAGEFDSGATPRWLAFCGPTGTGKTFLARQVRRYWNSYHGLWRGQSAQGDWTQRIQRSCVINWAREIARAKDSKAWGFVRGYDDYPMLVIDDPSKAYETGDWAKSQLFELLEYRRDKWTVTTWNLDLEEISARFEPAIKDRLIRGGNRVIELPPETPSYAER